MLDKSILSYLIGNLLVNLKIHLAVVFPKMLLEIYIQNLKHNLVLY